MTSGDIISQLNKKFDFSMLAIFKCLEILVSLFIEEKRSTNSRHAYWLTTGEKINHFSYNEQFPRATSNNDKNDSTINKIRIFMYEKLNMQDKDAHEILSELTDVRNNVIHPRRLRPIIEKDILNCFKVLHKILVNYNKLYK